MPKHVTRYIFITGGVVSSLGKGLGAAALGALLQARGYKVRLRKLDPYLNVDPGTMSPIQHGEVFVTEDGAETDLDLGHYERFTGVDALRSDSVSAGRIYRDMLDKERHGDYLGATIQIVPHVTDAIKDFIKDKHDGEDFVICEIGGTVGDIESLPFLEAIRQLGNETGHQNVCYLHVTLVPYIKAAGELKTKPTQHSVKELQSVGIRADIVLCRTEHEIPDHHRWKIAQMCNLERDRVIPGMDVDNIYKLPISYHEDKLDCAVIKHFDLPDGEPKLDEWKRICKRIDRPQQIVKIAIVGKYTALQDSYKSLCEALTHAGIAKGVKVKIEWIESEVFEGDDDESDETRREAIEKLQRVGGLIVPGGFGERGAQGKIFAIRYARENDIPFLGICFGMQMAVIETARNLAKIPKAGSSEFGKTSEPVVGLMTEWMKDNEKATRSIADDKGGTMRLGSYRCDIAKGTRAHKIYKAGKIRERHRHRYEVNITYKERLEKAGMTFSGMSPDKNLPEIVERGDHPWFVGVQFHPELKSRPFKPHPLFVSFVAASILSISLPLQ